MGRSNADARRKAAADRKAAGIELDKSGKEKKAAPTQVVCKQCSQSFRVTKRNVEMKSHWEAKHTKSSFDDCFPGQTYEQ